MLPGSHRYHHTSALGYACGTLQSLANRILQSSVETGMSGRNSLRLAALKVQWCSRTPDTCSVDTTDRYGGSNSGHSVFPGCTLPAGKLVWAAHAQWACGALNHTADHIERVWTKREVWHVIALDTLYKKALLYCLRRSGLRWMNIRL